MTLACASKVGLTGRLSEGLTEKVPYNTRETHANCRINSSSSSSSGSRWRPRRSNACFSHTDATPNTRSAPSYCLRACLDPSP